MLFFLICFSVLVFFSVSFVLGSFWEVVGGGFGDQVRFKTALEAILFEKSECSRKALLTNEQTRFPSPRGEPKRSKIAPRWPQDGLFFGSFFAYFFASNFDRFLYDFGAILGGLGEPDSGFLRSILG